MSAYKLCWPGRKNASRLPGSTSALSPPIHSQPPERRLVMPQLGVPARELPGDGPAVGDGPRPPEARSRCALPDDGVAPSVVCSLYTAVCIGGLAMGRANVY